MEFLCVIATLLLFISAAGSDSGGMASTSRKWTHINNPNSNAAARMAGLTAVRRHNRVLLPGEVALTFCWVEEAKVKRYNSIGDEYKLTVTVRADGTEGERVADVKVAVFRGFPNIVMRLKAFLYKPKVKAGIVPSNDGDGGEVAPDDSCI